MPERQREFGELVSTVGAGFAGRGPAVDHYKRLPCPLGLVLKLATEFAPTAVGDRSGQPLVADQVSDGEVFDGDQVMIADKAGGMAVQEVFSRVADFTVRPCDLGLGFATVHAAFLTASHPPLIPGQVAGLTVKMARVGDPISSGVHNEVQYAEIDTNCSTGVRRRFRTVGVDGEGDIPTSIRLSRHNNHRGVEFSWIDVGPGPHEPQSSASFRKPQLPVAHPERRPRVVRRLFASTGLEPRITGTASEKVAKRDVLMPQRLLRGNARHLRQKRQLLGALPSSQCGISVPIRNACSIGTPTAVPLEQGLVPHQPHTPKRTVNRHNLLRVGVGPAPVRRTHKVSLCGAVVLDRPARCSVGLPFE